MAHSGAELLTRPTVASHLASRRLLGVGQAEGRKDHSEQRRHGRGGWRREIECLQESEPEFGAPHGGNGGLRIDGG